MNLLGALLTVTLWGVAVVWVVAALPAGLVTLLKGHRALFLIGLFSFGLGWLCGAVALAKPESWWFRRVYGEEQRVRTLEPLRHPRNHRTTLGRGAAVVLAILVVGVLSARPATVVGVDGAALAVSVGAVDPCAKLPPGTRPGQPKQVSQPGTWRCHVAAGSDHYSAIVRTNERGCWRSRSGFDEPRRGCITIVSVLRS